MDDEHLEPFLGKMRAAPPRAGERYLNRVLAARERAGARRARSSKFLGTRTGRGAGMARLICAGDRFASLRSRRGIVKTRLVRLGAKGVGAMRAHLKYIERDGVERDGAQGRLYSASEDAIDAKPFVSRCEGDRHQFRLIVSAEDGDQYDDLKSLVRRLMAQLEKDLKTRLDWVAADHFDTGRPHSHIVIRGRDDKGENLVIARDYIRHGMRERLAEIINRDLGPRQDFEIEQKLRQEVGAERLTSIDRALAHELGPDRSISAAHRDPFRHSLRTGRLRKLESLGLAEPIGESRWRLADGFEAALREMGERGDIIRTMQRRLTAAGIERAPADRIIHMELGSEAIVGRLVSRGLHDEHSGTEYLIVDGIDGGAHHVRLGSEAALEPVDEGAILRVSPAPRGPRAADRTIGEIAELSGGFYSPELHRDADPSAGDEYVAAHVRRLEALRRSGLDVERSSEGVWTVGADFAGRAAAFDERRRQLARLRVEILSPLALGGLATRDGATWLDAQLAAEEPLRVRDAGFGRELRSALEARRRWLLERGLAEEQAGEFMMKPGALAILRAREIHAAAASLSSELDAAYVAAEEGATVSGVLRRRIDLACGRFALLENAREFTLVPWRPVLERYRGREIAGLVRGSSVSWHFGRTRGMEI